MAAVEMPERGSFNGPASRCAVCPFAGLCTPCRPQTVESGKVLVVNSIKELLQKQELPRGIIYFSPEPPMRTSEKTCSECNKPASTCLHSETSNAMGF